MKIGYPCLNLTLDCTSSKTFRLKSYSEERLVETVESNLDCLLQILRFNVENRLLFFRITSDLVPFASHPVCEFNWEGYFRDKFQAIGNFIKEHEIRISMHPNQFTLLNPLDEGVYERSVRELTYHAKILDLLGLNVSSKIQIHIGGIYKDKEESIKRFIRRFEELDGRIKRRLVIENDDRLYTLEDCLLIHAETETPILFDVFHYELNNSRETLEEAFELFSRTWQEKDGAPMVDYSSQQTGTRRGSHAVTIDAEHFESFLNRTKPFDFDVMLEIKDKERSALKAVRAASGDRRFRRVLEEKREF